MGRPAGWMQKLTGRAAMRSPGAPSLRREVKRQFWQQIATGITSERAAEATGVSQAVGTRWFRHRGGMPLFMSSPVSGKYLSFAEREDIGLHGRRFKTRRAAMDKIVDWLLFYNHRRLHSSLGHLSPMQFEQAWLATQQRQAA